MLVTVVTPTLNAVRYLPACIESVKEQNSDLVEVEHVIVDGGSSDGTVELARSHGLRVLEGKDDGIFDAINKGTFDSSGELVGFLGADDLLLPGGLDRIVRAYRATGRRWITGGVRYIDNDGNNLGDIAAAPSWISLRMYASIGDWSLIHHMSTYIKRDFFVELGGFDKSYKISGDYELFARALAVGEPFARVNETIAVFGRTGENTSARNEERRERENRTIQQTYAPRVSAHRNAYRYGLKCWTNAMNPGWSIRKFALKLRPA